MGTDIRTTSGISGTINDAVTLQASIIALKASMAHGKPLMASDYTILRNIILNLEQHVHTTLDKSGNTLVTSAVTSSTPVLPSFSLNPIANNNPAVQVKNRMDSVSLSSINEIIMLLTYFRIHTHQIMDLTT